MGVNSRHFNADLSLSRFISEYEYAPRNIQNQKHQSKKVFNQFNIILVINAHK